MTGPGDGQLRSIRVMVWGGIAFLYVPLLLVIAGSLQISGLATAGPMISVDAYRELVSDREIRKALLVSLRIAFAAATGATIIGVLAAISMVQFDRFPGRTLFGTLLCAPFVVPEVITGLSFLLLFVAMRQLIGWPSDLGVTTIWLAHVTVASAYVAVLVGARLFGAGRALEEAARDLGASRLRAFTAVTLPIIAPALVAGWLLAFTLSLNDFVIASFVADPGKSTLPMVMFPNMQLGIAPKLYALGTILIALAAVTTIMAWRVARRGRGAVSG